MNSRLNKIKNELKEKRLDAVLVSSVPNITYLTGFSGFSTEEREAFILITKDNQYILTDKRYRDELTHVILIRQLAEKDLFQLEEVSSSVPYIKALKKLAKKHKIKKLGIEENNLTVSEYKSLKRCFNDLNHFSVSNLRVIKDEEEISTIQKAAMLTDKTFEYILTKIKPGISEKEIAFEIEFFIKKHGGDLAFPSIVAFGKNSAVPHYKPGNQKSKIKNQILLDFGAKVDNYCSDMTRVVFLGKATDEQKKVYKTVLEVQKCAIEFLDKETPCTRSLLAAKDVDKIAHDYIRSKGFGENIFHSLGHGVGLEIHEAPLLSPKSKEILKQDMVFTIEPGIYLPGNFGVRIEDLAVLEKSGLRLLSKSPKKLIEL